MLHALAKLEESVRKVGWLLSANHLVESLSRANQSLKHLFWQRCETLGVSSETLERVRLAPTGGLKRSPVGRVGKVFEDVRVSLLEAALVDYVNACCVAVDLFGVQVGQVKLELLERLGVGLELSGSQLIS